jgi:hypothetical protein
MSSPKKINFYSESVQIFRRCFRKPVSVPLHPTYDPYPARWAKKVITPNNDMVPKSGEDGKFQFSYFSFKAAISKLYLWRVFLPADLRYIRLIFWDEIWYTDEKDQSRPLEFFWGQESSWWLQNACGF